ncbi:MAG: phage tail protein [Bacteroidota bacterium]
MAYPPVSFSFQVTVGDDTSEAGFQEASGLNMEMGVEEVASGGENQFKYRLPTVNKFNNLVLKRGLVPKNSTLAAWVSDTLTGGLATPITTKSITVSLLDEEQKILVGWTFFNAYPVKWSISDFKSMENSYAVESLEFAYNYFKKNS